MTDTKPFRSLADVYREQGLCGCGCGQKANREVTEEIEKSFAYEFAGLLGMLYSNGHCFNGAPSYNREQALKNRSTPAPETGGAKSFDFGPFTREDWDSVLVAARERSLTAVVFLLDGKWLCASTQDGDTRAWSVVNVRDGVPRADLALYGFGNARAKELSKARSEHRVYPDDCPEARARLVAKPVEETYESPADACPHCYDGGACLPGGCGIDGCDRCGKLCPHCNGTCVLPAEATRYCAECRAPMKARPGREVCRYCDLRCGGYSDRPPHEAMLREESARQRMALMDERERPRPSRWSRELARKHPWECTDD